MPRYFFHLYNSIEVHDDEGTLLPNLETARAICVKNARYMIAEEIKTSGDLHLKHWMEIEDEHSEIVSILRYADVVTIHS